ncbi:hypothetical protein ACFLVG_05815 [Chloroflexota bacterium]
MNWDLYIIWHHYHWTTILFVIVISLEMAMAILYGKRLLSRKSKIGYQVNGVHHKGQQISTPINPIKKVGYDSTNSENNDKTNP